MLRRTFAATAITAVSYRRIMGANSTVRLGLIGGGGRGKYVTGFMQDGKNALVTAVADPWDERTAEIKAWTGGKAQIFRDFRKLLETDVDAVVVATPDHWHAYAAVAAAKADKHVFVEKPLSYTIAEGRAIAKAAANTRKLMTTGTQQRSADHFKEVSDIIQRGELGKVAFVRVWNFTNMGPEGIGKQPDEAAPSNVDWDLYCGPAPLRPFNRLRLGPTFRWFTDYANGTITDFGTHRFDTVHQIMGIDKREKPGPLKISAMGQRYALADAGEMPDLLQVQYDYGDFVMSYEACNMSGHGLGGRTEGMRYYNTRGEVDRPHGIAFYGTNGAVVCDRVGYEVFPDPKPIAGQWLPKGGGTTSARLSELPFEPRIEKRRKQSKDATSIHAQAFVSAILNGGPNPAPIEGGHRATSVALLGMLAYKVGARLDWDPIKERVTNLEEANRGLAREPRGRWTV
jgi:predicted dehydrogenase